MFFISKFLFRSVRQNNGMHSYHHYSQYQLDFLYTDLTQVANRNLFTESLSTEGISVRNFSLKPLMISCCPNLAPKMSLQIQATFSVKFIYYIFLPTFSKYDFRLSPSVSRSQPKLAYIIAHNGLGIAKGGDFLAQKFNRRTEVKLCTKIQSKSFIPALGNTLLAVRRFCWMS